MPERFDVIVVGAGLAGLSAAYTMARQGMSVTVLERADHPGSKNVMGGILYRQPAEAVFPDFWKTAPLERPIIEQNLWVLAGESLVKAGHRAKEWAREPYHGFSIMRGQFDAWLGQQVVEAGALIVPGTNVIDLLRDGRGQVIGARVNRPEGDLLTDLVILADGANSLLGERMGLHARRRTDGMAMSVKEVLSPPGSATERARWIEQRFGLPVGQGLTIDIVGSLTDTMVGKIFLYTNTETVTFGVSVLLSDLLANKVHPYALLQAARAHSAIASLLADCITGEYCAHLLPECGSADAPLPLFGPGVLVAGDAAGLGGGIYREGADMAMLSGKLAGETARAAHAKGDFSRQTLSTYADKVRQSAVFKDHQQYRKLISYLQQHRQFYMRDSEALSTMAKEYFAVDNNSRQSRLGKAWKQAGGKLQVTFDAWGLSKRVK